MVDWKAKLIELIPEERSEWEEEFSIYLAFGTLLGLADRAAKDQDHGFLSRCFAFAQWCFGQEEKDLWNAAGVSFY